MGTMIHGIRKTVFKNSGGVQYVLAIARPVTDFENDAVCVSGVGSFDSIAEFEAKRGAKYRLLEEKYAEQLVSTGAFVPYKEYDLIIEPNPNDPIEDMVTKLIPVDAEIKKHFEASLNTSKQTK